MAMMVSTTFNVQASEAQNDIGGARVQQDNGTRAEITGSDGSKAVVVAVFDGHGSAEANGLVPYAKTNLKPYCSEKTTSKTALTPTRKRSAAISSQKCTKRVSSSISVT